MERLLSCVHISPGLKSLTFRNLHTLNFKDAPEGLKKVICFASSINRLLHLYLRSLHT